MIHNATKKKNTSSQASFKTDSKTSQTVTKESKSKSTQVMEEKLRKEFGFLKVSDFFLQFWNFTKEKKQSHDVLLLCKALMSGKLPKDNMAWLCALHRGQYSNCTTTCNMKYDSSYTEFFSLFYHLFGASALNVLRGPAQFGSVITNTNSCSCYDPDSSKCNLAIPLINTLRKLDIGFDKKTPTGKITKSLEISSEDKEKQYVISFDGMQVSEGSKGKTDGDVDLWGAEGRSTIHTQAEHLDNDLLAVGKLKKHIGNCDLNLLCPTGKCTTTNVQKVETNEKSVDWSIFLGKAIGKNV